jgi:hypothetical protein
MAEWQWNPTYSRYRRKGIRFISLVGRLYTPYPWVGDWMGHRTNMNMMGKKIICASTGNRTKVVKNKTIHFTDLSLPKGLDNIGMLSII